MAERYLLVSEDVCPAIFGKVVQAKKLLTLYKDKTQTEILNEVGISRSAFYKYKDKVLYMTDYPTARLFLCILLWRIFQESSMRL